MFLSKLFKRAKATTEELIIADFDSATTENNLGGRIGISADPGGPAYDVVACTTSFVADDALANAKGRSLRVEYDLSGLDEFSVSEFGMALPSLDMSPFNTLRFYVKGDTVAGFTKSVKVGLWNKTTGRGLYVLRGITDKWDQVAIPFERFKGSLDWRAVEKFTLLFDRMNVDVIRGALYIDHLALSRD